jgi:hypothetical protein
MLPTEPPVSFGDNRFRHYPVILAQDEWRVACLLIIEKKRMNEGAPPATTRLESGELRHDNSCSSDGGKMPIEPFGHPVVLAFS